MADKGYTFAGVCKGTTKAGTPCKHTVVFANGLCRQHGGDSTEYNARACEAHSGEAKTQIRKTFEETGA